MEIGQEEGRRPALQTAGHDSAERAARAGVWAQVGSSRGLPGAATGRSRGVGRPTVAWGEAETRHTGHCRMFSARRDHSVQGLGS